MLRACRRTWWAGSISKLHGPFVGIPSAGSEYRALVAEVLAEQDDERLTEEPLNQQELLQVRWRTRPAEASGSRDESTPGGAKKMLEVSDDEGSCRNGGLLQALKDTVHIKLRALAAADPLRDVEDRFRPDPCRAGIDAQRCAPRRVPNADRWLVTSLGSRA